MADWQRDAVERDLRVDNPSLHARFQAFAPDAPLPWEAEKGRHDWTILDADGNEVCSFTRSPRADGLVKMIIVAANTCGGYRAT